jgi:ribosome-associated toxin RatA of RatAB toxin-antitoxin module
VIDPSPVEQGEQHADIAAPLERIVAVLTDFDHYPAWQPGVSRCAVLERDESGRGALVEMQVSVAIRRLRLRTQYYYDLPDGLGWRHVSGDLARNDGQYTFTPLGEGHTRVALAVAIEVGFAVPAPVRRLLREQSVRLSLRGLQSRAERGD